MALAIRSLGPLPEILYHAPEITDSMVEEAFDRDGSMTMLRQAFLPFALRNLDGVAAHTIMSALPETPSDPAQFFSIAGKRATLPPTSKEHVHVLRDPSNLPVAVAMQRVADPPKSVGCNELWAGISAHEPSARSFALWVEDCVATLRTALEKQTHESILSIGDVLDGRSRNILFPDPERLAKKLADSDRIAEMRTVIDAIAALPPAQSLIARFMLVAIAANASFCREWSFFRNALVEPLAVSLQSRGDLFLALYDAMKPSLRGIVLPSHPDGQLSENLRTIARNDPLHAYRTSCADAAFLSAPRKRTSGRSR